MKRLLLILLLLYYFLPVVSEYDDIISLQVNALSELSYKSKEEIFNLRKSFVAKSIFSTPDYAPSQEVFGQIVGGKPWIANTHCFSAQRNMAVVDGVSEESRYINNPNALVSVEFRWLWKVNNPDNYYFCKSDYVTTMIPKEIFYNKSKNEIDVVYEQLPFVDKKMFYILNGLNANDLGYKYAYLDKSKSTYHIDFVNRKNISNKIHKFCDYIHLGGSCKVPGGCNNASPRQPELEFINKDMQNSTNKYIYIKLWKNKPLTPFTKPDIVEKIIFEKS